jgi:short-subunit dehydrogenase
MPFTTILITGASSGIGAALARHYARPGRVLVLWGQNTARLEATAVQCRAAGAAVEIATFDLTQLDEVAVRLEDVDASHPLDLAIFNAGLGGSLEMPDIARDRISAERMATVNFTVPVICANLLATRMATRGKGRIVLVGSVAESFPLPMAPVYVGTKAGLAQFAEALGLRIARHGVGVTLVVPGFVDTPMSQGLKEPRPFLISAESAAATIARRVERGALRIVLPWQFAVIQGLTGILPRIVLRVVFRLAWRISVAMDARSASRRSRS